MFCEGEEAFEDIMLNSVGVFLSLSGDSSVSTAAWKILINQVDGILPKGPYPPCLRMADRALLAGYPQSVHDT